LKNGLTWKKESYTFVLVSKFMDENKEFKTVTI
jgi:hypothetical protein